MQTIMLATGIECSYPTIRSGSYRVDELEVTTTMVRSGRCDLGRGNGT